MTADHTVNQLHLKLARRRRTYSKARAERIAAALILLAMVAAFAVGTIVALWMSAS